MQAHLLTDDMRQLFTDVDQLADRHHAALAYAAAHERMIFLHEQVQVLHNALRELHAAARLLQAVNNEQSGIEIWQQTGNDLRRRMPAHLRAPGRAIVAGGLDLLRLVEYTGASTAMVAERRDRLVVTITYALIGRAREIAAGIVPLDVPMELHGAVWQATMQLAAPDNHEHPSDVAQTLVQAVNHSTP